MHTVFVVSDIHGHYTVLKDALYEAGFDPEQSDHTLLALGDYFDRGSESYEVYTYLRDLDRRGKARFILGNHDLFMLEFLEGKDDRTQFNILHNGFLETLKSFTGEKDLDPFAVDLERLRKKVNKVAPDLYDWLDSMPLYIEHEDTVFTHGGIDGDNPDWRKTPRERFVWNYQDQLTPLEGKRTVVGHDRTALIRGRHDPDVVLRADDKSLFKPIDDGQVLYIDSFVEFSKTMNVVTFTFERPLP